MGIGRYMAKSTGLYGYGWLFELIVLVLFILVIYWVVKSNYREDSAIDILNKRYAKGELSKKDYLSLKKEIYSEESNNGNIS